MYCRIYLFRHGQTYFNKNHYFCGRRNSNLTPRGIKDAKRVAKMLKSKKIDVAYRSTLKRSKDTLMYVLKYHPECKKIIIDDRMIERSYGRLQGKSHKHFADKVGKKDYKMLLHWHMIDNLHGKRREKFIERMGATELQTVRRSYDIPPPQGESVKDVEARVKPFIRDLLRKIKKEKINVAISAHGNSMRPFRKHFEKLTRSEMMHLENPWDEYFEYRVKV